MARATMGFDFGLNDPNTCFKRKNRWLFIIDGISADSSPAGVNSMPPLKSARPNVSFKEIEVQHINETVYLPGKPDWKPVNLTLYETRSQKVNPVFQWLESLYDGETGQYVPSGNGFKKPNARLELYDGCGGILETWYFENIWPQTIEFGDLDMATSDLITCDLILRFDRAYIN